MKNKTLIIITTTFVLFCFFIFLKGLNNPNTFVPEKKSGKQILSFSAKKLFNDENISLDSLFVEDKIYLLNLWSSWCGPCRNEHSYLMKLSKNPSIKIIGINYRDNPFNAKRFLKQLGNPYSEILVDKDGTIAISLGAYGVPETYVLDKNKKILNKFVGPLNSQLLKEIENLIK